MLKHRVIPCLLLSNAGLVKTTKFGNAKYIGDPINAIRVFNDKEVDELMVLDINASKDRKGPNFELIEQFAGECFMPLCYGGGIRTVEQAHQLFALGVEKVSLQTAILNDTSLITQIAERYGSQSVLVSVDIKRNLFGATKIYSSAKKSTLAEPWMDFIKKVVAAGAGEIILNAVDCDGTMKGMDISLIKKVSSALPVPVIAVGGVGSLQDIKAAVDAGASAVGVGAFFVLHGPHRAVLITYPRYKDLETLLTQDK